MDAAERLALTAFCAELPELRAECAVQPVHRQRLLARIEEEARQQRPILALLAELLGTSPSDAVRSLSGGLPGAGLGRAHEEKFVCPSGACDRTTSALPAGPVPRCPLTGDAMRSR